MNLPDSRAGTAIIIYRVLYWFNFLFSLYCSNNWQSILKIKWIYIILIWRSIWLTILEQWLYFLTWELIKIPINGARLQNFWFSRFGVGPKFCISNKHPRCANAAGSWTTLQEPLSQALNKLISLQKLLFPVNKLLQFFPKWTTFN